MKESISYGRQTIEEDDIEAVVSVLRSAHLTQGPHVELFEEALASYTGARYAVACSNGTTALHMALLAGGVKSGETAITSPITFLASANAAIYAGADVAFADIDSETFNIDPAQIENTLDKHKNATAIIPVHFAGLPCDMEKIQSIAKKRGLLVVEDACHALGASMRDSKGERSMTGACSHSNMSVFSFHPVKSITTGEGGAVTTNDPALYEKLKTIRSHGVTKDPAIFTNPEGLRGPWYYEMHEPGYNYRITDMQAALGTNQLKKLDRFIKRRAEIAALYDELFAGNEYLKTPSGVVGFTSARHLYPLRIDFAGHKVPKADFFEEMKKEGIYLQVHYIPVHLQPYYSRRYNYKPGDFPNAESFYAEEVSLPIYPLLREKDVRRVAAKVIEVFESLAKGTVAR